MITQQLNYSFLGEYLMKKTRTQLGLIFALTLGASAAANGSIYNNIPDLNTIVDPGPPPVTAGQYISDGVTLSNLGGYLASQFTTNSSDCTSGCTLGNITLNMFSIKSPNSPVIGTTGFHLNVYTNDDSTIIAGDDPSIAGDEMFDQPGTSLTTLNNPANFTPQSGNNVFTPSGTVNLASNTKYWVVLSADSSAPSNVFTTWSILSNNDATLPPLPNAGQPSLFILNLHSGAPVQNDFFTDPQLLMKVDAIPAAVPLPGAAWLMGSALLGLMRPWRRKVGH
jgi:hypothetical protein